MTEAPKHLYLLVHKDVAEKFAELSLDRVMRITTTFAFSQLAFEGGLSKEQTEAVKRYIDVLMEMGNPPVPPPTYPSKELSQ